MDTSLVKLKKVWIIVFCFISLITCLFFVPHKVLGYKDRPTGDTEYLSVFQTKMDSHYRYKLQIDYPAMIFRELVIAVGCIGGYTLATMMKK